MKQKKISLEEQRINGRGRKGAWRGLSMQYTQYNMMLTIYV